MNIRVVKKGTPRQPLGDERLQDRQDVGAATRTVQGWVQERGEARAEADREDRKRWA
jgi:hypothetical protein